MIPVCLASARARLQHLRQQFDVVPPDIDFSPYRLVVIPETTRIDVRFKSKLQADLKQGGELIVAGPAALDENGQPVLPETGIQTHGALPAHTFLRPMEEAKRGLPEFDFVMYEPGFRMIPAAGAAASCR